MIKSSQSIGIKEVKFNHQMNLFSIGDRSFILNDTHFVVIDPDTITTNHNPEGLYISLESIYKFIQQNTVGIESNLIKQEKAE